MHQLVAHEYQSEVSARVDTARCPHCLIYFHTHRRLMHHMMRDRPMCGERAIQHMPRLAGVRPYEACRGALSKLPTDSTQTIPPQKRAAVRMPGPSPRWAVDRA
eukprot:15463035-Alexandrium_andersonii.AAC.1